MERKTTKKIGMLLRVLSSKKFRTAKRGNKLEKVEALAQKRITETTKIIDLKLAELDRAEQEKAALLDLKDICENLKNYSKDNITQRVGNIMQFFGIAQPGEGAPRKRKAKKEKAEGAATDKKPAEKKPAEKKPAEAPKQG